MTLRLLYEAAKKRLEAAGIVEAALDARLLLEYACRVGHHDLLAHGEREVAENEAASLMRFIERRATHVPLQYLTGICEFMGLEFLVDERVLIPRQDTEILVEEVLRSLHDGFRILDMCTGSGCILLSLLHYSNGCMGVGADLSMEALAVARENARRFLEENVTFISGDLFENITGQFEIIVSNPPYIRATLIDELMEEVRCHEPHSALDGGEDGLDFYRKIVPQSRRYLCGGGQLFVEIGYDQREAVERLFEQAGYRQITTVQDFSGHDRVVYATLPSGWSADEPMRE